MTTLTSTSQKLARFPTAIISDVLTFDLELRHIHSGTLPDFTGFSAKATCGRAVICSGSKVIPDSNIEDKVRFDIIHVRDKVRDKIGQDQLIQIVTGSPRCIKLLPNRSQWGNPDDQMPRHIALYGDISAILAKAHGFAGALINAPVRDRVQLATLGGFNVIHRGTNPNDAYGRWHINHIYSDPETLKKEDNYFSIESAVVFPLDYVHFDGDGFCFIPAHLAEEVLPHAQRRLEKENKMRLRLASRESPQKVYEEEGKW